MGLGLGVELLGSCAGVSSLDFCRSAVMSLLPGTVRIPAWQARCYEEYSVAAPIPIPSIKEPSRLTLQDWPHVVYALAQLAKSYGCQQKVSIIGGHIPTGLPDNSSILGENA